MKTEPLVTLASITAGATALLGLLVAFGVPLTEGQQVAVLAVVAVAAPFVVALAGRGQVTPNASVVELALPVNTPGKRLVVAGEANEIETGKTIRVLEDNPSDPGAGRRRGRRTHGGAVLPKPEKDNGLGRVMLRLKARVLVLLTAFAVVSAGLLGMSARPAVAAGTSDVLGCKVEHGGAWTLDGEWVKVRCTGVKFSNPKKYGKHSYRAFVWCDRLAWQSDRKDVGSWETSGTSVARCDAIGDWGAVRWGYEWR